MANVAQKRKRYIYMFDGGVGRQYIGQTVDLKQRSNGHRQEAKRGRRAALYNFARKHGWDALPMRTLAYGWWTDEQANAAEGGYIAYHDTFHNGLNETRGGGGSTGWVPSAETRARMSATHKGMPAWNRGVPHSPKHRARISASTKLALGRPETKAKLSLAKKGKPHSPEHAANIAAALRGKPKSPEHVAKVAAAKRGKPHSPEARARISVGVKAALAARRKAQS